jgi:serine/threonine protein kinase
MSEPVTRLNAALEGRYRIRREIGEGGMATVYLADDLRHERKVALKVLKPELAAVVGADRFLAEIRTTANLQHPHILPLFDSGEADSYLYYVMPHVEGETLRDRLEREKQLPVDEAVRIATDVAEALHSAHEQGIIHRDVKPANILMSKGRPLVADFGIALAVAEAGGGRLTETGLSMGTPFYMSPEQASADREPSAASDVYSLACVLYEMLVGDPPYMASSAQAVLAKILTEEARAPTAARASIPPNVDAAIKRALEKVPADRFTSAQDFAKALADPAFRYGDVAATAAVGDAAVWKRLSIATSLSTVVLASVAAWALLRPEQLPPSVARFESPFREGQAPLGPSEILRDGSGLVYVGAGSGSSPSQLWLRRWDDLDARPIPGTEGARVSFSGGLLGVSPDGQEVAFVTGGPGPLRVVPLAGGPSRTLIDLAWEAFWSHDGWIYFMTENLNLARVPSSGGVAQAVTELLEGESIHAFPHLLPDGNTLLFQVFHGGAGIDAEIWALDLETGDRRALLSGNNPRYAASGHLLFGSNDGRLMAAPFDPDAAEVTGEPTPVVEGVRNDPSRGHVTYTISEDGTLAYVGGIAASGAVRARLRLFMKGRRSSFPRTETTAGGYLRMVVRSPSRGAWTTTTTSGSRRCRRAPYPD